MPMEWLLDRFKARTTKIWPFAATGALGTTAAAKAHRWDGASFVASLRVSRGGEASDGASPCKSRGQSKGVPGWWS